MCSTKLHLFPFYEETQQARYKRKGAEMLIVSDINVHRIQERH